MIEIEIYSNKATETAVNLLTDGGRTSDWEVIERLASLLEECGHDNLRIFRKNEDGTEYDIPIDRFINAVGFLIEIR